VAGLYARSEGKPFFPISLLGGAGATFWDRGSFPDETTELLERINNNLTVFERGWSREFRRLLKTLLNKFPRIVIIHGRSPHSDTVAQVLLEAGATPIILNTTSGGGTLADLWDRYAKDADGAVAIATPDDVGAAAVNGKGEPVAVSDVVVRHRARQNVWAEIGWAWGRLSLDKLRIVMPETPRIEIPSDLKGLRVFRYSSSPEECKRDLQDFCRRLESA